MATVTTPLEHAGASSPTATPTTAPTTTFSPLQLEELRSRMATFAAERDWDQYHTPRNLVLALVGEAGELAEIFQWRGEVAPGLPGFSERDREHVGEELSDVLLYLVRLADRSGIDLAAAALRKMRLNAAKYPADRARGSAAKYTAYATASLGMEIKSSGAGPQSGAVSGSGSAAGSGAAAAGAVGAAGSALRDRVVAALPGMACGLAVGAAVAALLLTRPRR